MAGLYMTPIGVSRPCQVQPARSTLSQGVQRRPNGKCARNLVMQAAVRQRLGNRAGRQVEEEDVAVEEEEEELDEEEIDGVDLGADEPAAAVAAAGTEAVPEASTAAGAAGSKDARVYEPATYALNFLWLEKNIAVAVDQVFTKDARAPLSEYFFWPRKDAWEELKATLEAKPWISERDKVLLLNRTTEVINFWQSEGEKHTLAEAQEQFPDCTFMGA